jgi:hypothetical protein
MANSLHDKWIAFLGRAVSDDYMITGGTTRSALNDNLLAASGSAAIDTLATASNISVRSIYVQVIGSSGISSGQIIFEGSNDNVTFVAIPWFDQTSASVSATVAAFNVAASANKFEGAPVSFRYLRVRISTAFVGGTVSAIARLSPSPFPIQVVTQGSATNLKASVIPIPNTAGGNTPFTASIGNTATQVKSGAGQVYGWDFGNNNAAVSYVQFFNTAVGSVTVGTTTPVLSIEIPANTSKTAQWPHGIPFSTAIVVACTTTRAGSTSPGSTVDLNILYT